jgi:hypothetical protein
MWLPAAIDAATEGGWKLFPFVKFGCPVADGNDKASAECEQWRAWAADEIGAIHPDVTIVANLGGATNAYATNLNSVLIKLKALSGRVVLLSDVPVPPDDPVLCLDKPGATLGGCMVPLGAAQDVNAVHSRVAATAGVEFADFTPWFCYRGHCPVVVSNMIVYFDAGHLTRTYSSQLAPYFGRRLGLF